MASAPLWPLLKDNFGTKKDGLENSGDTKGIKVINYGHSGKDDTRPEIKVKGQTG